MPGTMGKSLVDDARGRAGMLVAHLVDMFGEDGWDGRPREPLRTKTSNPGALLGVPGVLGNACLAARAPGARGDNQRENKSTPLPAV